MLQIIIDAINDAQKEIILASRFLDESIVGANGYNPSTTDRNDLGARYP